MTPAFTFYARPATDLQSPIAFLVLLNVGAKTLEWHFPQGNATLNRDLLARK